MKIPLPLNSLVQRIYQRIFLFETSKTSDYAQNGQNRPLTQGMEQGIQGISRQASERYGVTPSFAAKTAKLTAKQQGMPELTVQLTSDEKGIAVIRFPHQYLQAAGDRSDSRVCI